MYEKELKKLGLTDGESRVYIALLNLGSSTVGPIVKKSKVAYSKIYEVLDRLVDKGLVSFITKQKTKYFQSLGPERLKEHIQKQKQEIEENEKLLDKLIPQLKSSKKKTQETEVFTGEKGIMTAYDILLDKAKKNSTLRFFYMHDPLYDEKVYEFCYGRVNYNDKKIVPMLKKKNIRWLGIVNDTNYAKKIRNSPKPIIQRYVDFPIPGNIDITSNSILITVWEDNPIGILIHSEEVAKNFKRYFDSIWEIAEKK